MTGAVMMTLVPWVLVGLVAAVTAHAGVNALLLRQLPALPSTVDYPVAVLLPVRDEAHRVRPCLQSLMAQRGLSRLEIVVLDDGSSDGTVDVVRAVAGADPRVRLVTGEPLPDGWLGKPFACHQLAARADPGARALVFVDADVVLGPEAVAAATSLLADFDLVSPYPRLLAHSPAERLLQPLVPWSWLSFLPLRAMERSRRPTLAAAGGQFLAVTRSGYTRTGGHAAVRNRVLEDLELARAVKRAGGRICVADGSRMASCRMYRSWRELRDGYSKSLWAAFPSPLGAAAAIAFLLLLYAAPAALVVAAALTGAWAAAGVAAIAYLLGVLGRVISGSRTGAQVWPDALAHPVSVILLVWLIVRSHYQLRRGRLTWKGRGVTA